MSSQVPVGEQLVVGCHDWPGSCKAAPMMRLLRSAVSSLFLVLGCSPILQAAEPFRLFEIAVTRFTAGPDDRATLELGLLNAKGELRITESHVVAAPPRMDPEGYGQLLVSTEAWFAFQSLGPQALANFERTHDARAIAVAGIPHYRVAAREDAHVSVGRIINLATRGVVAPGPTPTLVGGFVIEGQARRVLVRAIGPSLMPFGVEDALADPFLTIHRNGLPLHFNGDWGERPDAAGIAEAARQMGAFPLAAGSKDAVLLVELPPGSYTASVVSQGPMSGAGTALLEIYLLP